MNNRYDTPVCSTLPPQAARDVPPDTPSDISTDISRDVDNLNIPLDDRVVGLCEEPWGEASARDVGSHMDRRSMLRSMGLAAVMTSVGSLAAGAASVEAGSASASTGQGNTGQSSDVVNREAPSLRKPIGQRITASSGPAAASAMAVEPLPSLEIIALNRMAFGPRPGDLADFLALGNTPEAQLQAYVEQQLNPGSIDDSACDAIINSQGFQTMDLPLNQAWIAYTLKQGEENKDNDRLLPIREVEKAAFLRAINSKRQLTEVLADFWHNHFNVFGWNRWEGSTFRSYDRDVIRANMFGNFRQMLEAVAKSPAMLYYLDNQSNEGGNPNENYARELFELHAMGAENYLGVIADLEENRDLLFDENGNPKGYVDDWVYGATTCFTGWRVDGETGAFAYDDTAHFRFQKFVFGLTLPPFQGEKDGHDVLDLLVNHPGTARYISRKLCRRFISDNPPESIVQAAADVFSANIAAPDQLTKVMRAILLSDEFKTTWGEKIKRPFEYAVSLMRSLEYDFEPRDRFFWRYDPAGQPLFAWPAPDGFPDNKERWIGTMSMLQRMRLCNFLLDWEYDKDSPNADQYYFRPREQTPSSIKTPQGLVDYWGNRILGRSMPTTTYNEIVDFMAEGRNPTQELPENNIDERLRYMVALIFMSPTFMLR